METGLMNREKTLWIPKKPNCEGGQEFVSVGIGEIKPALHALVAGYGLAFVMFIAERIFKYAYHRIYEKHLNNQSDSMNENLYSASKIKKTKHRITKYGLNI